jgi:hypothetical protein
MSGKSYYTLEKNFDETIKEIQELKEYTLNQMSKLEESVGIKKINKIEQLNIEKVRIRYQSESSRWSAKYGFRIDYGDEYKFFVAETENQIQEAKEKLKAIVEQVAKSDEEIHLSNMKKINENIKTKETVFGILEKIGVSSYYYGYKTSRSRNQTKMYYHWSSEISKQIPTSYDQNKLENAKNKSFKFIDDECRKLLDKIRIEKAKKEQEEKTRRDNEIQVKLLVKYGLEIMNDWDDLLEVVLQKDKYLKLAYSMEATRNDWSDGFYKVENAISNFNVETDEDSWIYEDIQKLVYGEERDGRIFRDCKYNYSVLYEKVESDLLKDFHLIYEKTDLY